MATITNTPMTAALEGDFVVFLIGMRINRPWKVGSWWPVARAMPRMIRELYQKPELGLLHHEAFFGRTTLMVQYWKSTEHLIAYAKSSTSEHLPAWAEFNRRVRKSADVGIWHETYSISEGRYECFYGGMPRFGLAAAGEHVEALGRRRTARGRLGQVSESSGNTTVKHAA